MHLNLISLPAYGFALPKTQVQRALVQPWGWDWEAPGKGQPLHAAVVVPAAAELGAVAGRGSGGGGTATWCSDACVHSFISDL